MNNTNTCTNQSISKNSRSTCSFMVPRDTWEQQFMAHAVLFAQRSTCLRLQTGAVLVKDNRIISAGYNGVVSHAQHCCDYWKEYVDKENLGSLGDFVQTETFSRLHHEWATENELHGEQNAILYACKRGIKTKNADLYTVYAPCINCAKVIVTAGIKRVYYQVRYSRDVKGVGIQFLNRNHVEVYQVDEASRKIKSIVLI